MGKAFKIIWNEFVYGGHLVSVGLACIVILAAILLGIKLTWDFPVVIYLLSLAPCLFGRYFGLKEDALTNPERSEYLGNKAKMIPYIVAVLLLLMFTILVAYHRYSIILFATCLILLSFIYDLYLKKLTRVIVGFKNYFIGIVFTSLIFMLAISYSYQFSLSFILVTVFIFIMSAMGAAFSDIKDIESDKKAGLKTFAVVLGRERLLYGLSFFIILALISIFVGVYLRILPSFALMLFLVLPYNIMLFLESRKPDVKVDFLYGAAFDSQLILWLLLVLIGRVLFV